MSSLPMPKVGVPSPGFYLNYKHDSEGPIGNHTYEVLGVGFHTEESRSGEEHFVIYRPLYESLVYKASKELRSPCFDSKPLEMWMEEVDKDGKKSPRYVKITDTVLIEKLEKIKQDMY